MQNNEEQSHESARKPTADDIAGEFSAVRKSAVWGGRETTEASNVKVVQLNLTDVDPDPNQPRRYFDQKGLEELAASIRDRGQLNPVLVRPHPQTDGRFMLIGGERRYRVLKSLERESILAIVLTVNEQEAREIALIDNLQRSDLSPFEEAAGYQRLIDEFKYTQEQVAQTVGKDQTNVSMTLRLNDLPKKIKNDEMAHRVSKSVLLELARVEDKKQQGSLWSDIKNDIKAGTPVTVRGIRTKRGVGQTPAAAATPTDRLALLGRTVSHLSKQLESVSSEELAANTEQQQALRALRERLDTLLSPLPEQASAEQVSPGSSDLGQEAAQA
jgi:ParB family transcriptional regulator, chromosome partitioning protein